MRKSKHYLTISLILVMVLSLIVVLNLSARDFGKKFVTINKSRISVEVAKTPQTLEKGLGFRNSLEQNSGMLFIFPEARTWEFWMEGMRFPLDFMWIENNKVVDIAENIPSPNQTNGVPRRLQPKVPVHYVLEVNAGWIAKHQIKIGDTVDLHI
jgi:uncharacterized membrane protein (UPF0127 family)